MLSSCALSEQACLSADCGCFLTSSVHASFFEVYNEQVRCICQHHRRRRHRLRCCYCTWASLCIITFSGYLVYCEQVFDLFASEEQQQQQQALISSTNGHGGSSAADSAERPAAGSGADAATRVALRVREHPVQGIFVEGLASLAVTSYADVARLLAAGGAGRVTASTEMNSAR